MYFFPFLALIPHLNNGTFRFYYPLDINSDENPPLQDPHDSSQYVTYDNQSSLYWIKDGPSNQALCVDDASDATYTIPMWEMDQEKFLLSLWLKHHCNKSDDSLILHSRWFTMNCYPYSEMTSSQRAVIALTVNHNCHFHFPVSNGIWYFLRIRRFDLSVKMEINGVEVEDLVQECDKPLAKASDMFRLGSYVCVDEIFGSKRNNVPITNAMFSTVTDLNHIYQLGEYQ